jgi:hypothetical protein
MVSTDAPDDADAVASHTLACRRSHGKKLDLVLETLARHGERLGRLEREVGEGRRDVLEMKRDVLEVKSDIALLENKVLTAQTEILTVLYRLDQQAVHADGASETPAPDSAG